MPAIGVKATNENGVIYNRGKGRRSNEGLMLVRLFLECPCNRAGCCLAGLLHLSYAADKEAVQKPDPSRNVSCMPLKSDVSENPWRCANASCCALYNLLFF